MSLKKRDKIPDERMAYLVVVIVQEGNNKQFCVCLMSQNRVVVEKKTIFQTRTQPHVILLLVLTTHNSGLGTLLRNENHTNSFRIRWHSRFCGQNVSSYMTYIGGCVSKSRIVKLTALTRLG